MKTRVKVPTVAEDRDTEKESDHPEHPSDAALLDHVCRTRLAKSYGSRDDSLSWNLSCVKQGGAIRTTTWIHGGEGVRWRGGRKSRSETTGRCTSRSRLARRRHQLSQLSQLDQTNQCIEATGAAQSEQLGGAQDLRQ